ncbi:hypothetical protein D3C83_331950 [compost metagenome]
MKLDLGLIGIQNDLPFPLDGIVFHKDLIYDHSRRNRIGRHGTGIDTNSPMGG